ncbi:MAG: hypothetical protein OEW92_03540 [Gammaproteobacteria bacterium]|jgi:hypothetical protein|nr:hypothetical protein [Gammaproteobacteria bacterium]MDH5171466.1 hypothetical protein [Gammaproteobacteria bacterium]
MTRFRILLLFICATALTACKQPLAIEGSGDIVELNRGERGCALEEFRAGWARCTDNDVLGSESLRYRALPRAGWKFSHWDGNCAAKSPGQDCLKNYDKTWVQWWDDNYPDEVIPPLTAVFVPDSGAPAAVSYIASRFGAVGRVGFAALLDALFQADGSYRFTSQQAGTRSYFDRTPASFLRQKSGLLLAGPDSASLVPSGGATAAGDFLTLADTDTSDNEVSVAYLMPEQAKAQQGAFNGTYFCGHILSNGQALFFRANMDGRGGGALIVLNRRLAGANQAAISYRVSPDGTTTLDYAGARLAGSLSPDGSVFTATQVSPSLQGAGICLRTSGNKMVGNVTGSYYGAWISTQPVTAVTELLLDKMGQTAETVLRDSAGGRNYALGQNFMLVKATGQITTRDADGAVSPDGRVMFIVQTDPNRFPTLIVYVRKT